MLRQSIDEVLDGQRTGRFDLNSLAKTEKTYLGTKVEIVARAEFGLGDGRSMDYSIAGHDVDAKFTMLSNWSIPKEAMGHMCLLMKANDRNPIFQVGLLRIREELLNQGSNRDGKRTLSGVGRSAIRWIIPSGSLPPNILLNLPEADRSAIFTAGGRIQGQKPGGQQRINELFRRVQGARIDRNAVLTVASQDDGPKRVRDARGHLRSEGIMILGDQQRHPHIARALDLPIPGRGSWVAVRVSRFESAEDAGRPVAQIGENWYAVWSEGDTPTPAPASY
ncbi:restriction endonuclease [Streptomyces yaizuensis]|uniref:Restriction endonuclease n=1 Tax=Streptomyces yaizuensis TaxID=2989713 RepID=A0ABQ5NT32_9ACTN|nr:restriction endonuclease [Streptomyces sp. YSPA8]